MLLIALYTLNPLNAWGYTFDALFVCQVYGLGKRTNHGKKSQNTDLYETADTLQRNQKRRSTYLRRKRLQNPKLDPGTF